MNITKQKWIASYSFFLLRLCATEFVTIVYKLQRIKSIILICLTILPLIGCAPHTEIESTLDTGVDNTPS